MHSTSPHKLNELDKKLILRSCMIWGLHRFDGLKDRPTVVRIRVESAFCGVLSARNFQSHLTNA